MKTKIARSLRVVLTRSFITIIVVVIAAIYYLSELRPFPYEGYDRDINLLQRYDAELNEAIVQTRFGILKNYDPIVQANDGVSSVIKALKNKELEKPNPYINNKLNALEIVVKQKETLTQNFKRINPILINAINQFSTILAQIIESEANDRLVESCNELLSSTQLIDKANNLFRGILIYVSQRSEEKHQDLVNLVQEIRSMPQKLPKLDLALTYADKILELQPQLSLIDEELYQVPIVPTLNALNEGYIHAFKNYLSEGDRFRIILYLLAFLLVVVLRWTFSRLRGTVKELHTEVEQKIKAQEELAQTNRELENRVAQRTYELTVKNKDLNQALADLNEAQEQLIMQEKMASVGMLTTGIAHEIKNPLNFVNNFSDISIELVKELNDELQTNKENIKESSLGFIQDILEDLKTNCTKIKEHGVRADNIVKNMLMHSQEAGVQKEMIDIKSLMEDNIKISVESFNTTHGKFDIKLEKEFDPNPISLLVAPQSIGRVFIYLIDNALYAMRDQKQKSPPDYQPILQITIQKREKDVLIKIRDNGTGIPKKSLDRIFDPFFTTKPTGKGNTGLGLSICYDTVVKQHKGELRATSEEGVYSEFMVILPLPAKAAS